MTLTVPMSRWSRETKRTKSIDQRLQELEKHVARLEQYQVTQHAITQIIARSSDLDSAIPSIIQAICETADWDFGEVWHMNRKTSLLSCAASWGKPSFRCPKFEQSSRETSFAPGKGLPGRVWDSAKPLWMTNVVTDASFLRAMVAEHDGLHAGLGIPIRAGGEIIGVMTFFSRETRQPERDLLRLLDTVGSQIGLFIERKHAEDIEREQTRKLVAMEERQKLARDLHDSVTQTLFSASVIADMLPVLWSRNPEQVCPNLEALQGLTRGALAEMRSLLVELRPPTLGNGDFPELLKNLADTVVNGTNTFVALNVELPDSLPAEIQITFYRIIQEALNNIVKHAAATQVSVQLCAHDGQLRLCIEDNGRGFDMRNIPADHFGVGIMGERAEEIGATFHIESTLGKGTCITVTHPYSAQG